MKGIPKELLDRMEWKRQSKDSPEPPQLKKINYPPHPCSECGLEIECQGRVDYTLTSTPCTHWGAKCWICGLHRSPITGKIEVTHQEKRQQFEQLIREGKVKRTRKGANINNYKKKSYK